MERSEPSELAAAARRFCELDAKLRRTGLTMAVVAALASLAFWNTEPWLVFAAWSTPIYRTTRLFTRTEIGLYRWAISAMLVSGGALVLAAAVTGGLASPVVLFVMVVGLVASMSFATQPLWGLYPVALVLIIGAIDIARGGAESVSFLLAASVIIVSLTIPRLVTDMVAMELDYRRKAVIDPLTGCLNRSSMEIRMDELEHQAVQSGDHIGVIAIDIDHFKSVNDRFGHSVGDEVLQEVAYAIRRNLRRFELLYRTGGEEFVLLLPGANLEVSHALGEKIRTAVEEEDLSVGAVTISLGVAAEQAPSDLEALVEQADQNLLRAKRAGRNRTVSAATG